MGLTGMLSNMTEAKFAALKDPNLCPVLFALPGGFLTVMRRAEPLTADEFDSFFDSRGDRHFWHTEWKRCSFGRLDGRIVAVDYGEAYLGAGCSDLVAA